MFWRTLQASGFAENAGQPEAAGETDKCDVLILMEREKHVADLAAAGFFQCRRDIVAMGAGARRSRR